MAIKKKTDIKNVPTAKKPDAKKTVAKKAPPKKVAASATPAKKAPSAEEIYGMIQTAAYFAAANDGFKKDPSAYWLQAEAEVVARLKG